jgi:dephospho-CoA kinase
MRPGDRTVIGLAGNIGCGKSTAAAYFQKLGSRLIEADRIGWRVLNETRDRLQKLYGPGIIKGGRINRMELRTEVFTDRNKVRHLNRLTHPRLVELIRNRIRRIKTGMVVIDAALLFDWPDLMADVDHPILVTAPRKIKEQRALQKGIDRQTFQRILRFQKSEKVLSRQAEYVIRNDRSRQDLYRQCYNIYKEIKNDC